MGTLLRVVWFLLIGSWLSALWIMLSLAVTATVILAPVGLYMLSKTWQIATFKTSPTTVVVEAREQSG